MRFDAGEVIPGELSFLSFLRQILLRRKKEESDGVKKKKQKQKRSWPYL